jgi:hypothetical protein
VASAAERIAAAGHPSTSAKAAGSASIGSRRCIAGETASRPACHPTAEHRSARGLAVSAESLRRRAIRLSAKSAVGLSISSAHLRKLPVTAHL